ncbi:MAG: FAD-binding oxidoreductase, partial [Propionibacteriaceae bacterium]|nr:FAD-binding oxidoreductase [Propionibacteriaceae bacterium]
MSPTQTPLAPQWSEIFADQLADRPIDRVAKAHDASHYLLRPQGVLKPRHLDDIAAALKIAHSTATPVTFRSGGSSLSGQAGGSGIMIDVRRHFQQLSVQDGGARVVCDPGLTVQAVNAYLAPYQTMLGPDPASQTVATVGGVVANNSSGMACGIDFNTYQTISSLVVVLPSGTVVDTSRSDIDEFLRDREPKLYAGLAQLRDRVRGNQDSLARIQHQFSMKNTMGYSVNSFVDFDLVSDIFTHLMVGSEGTLGFIAEACFQTIPVQPKTATALLVFPHLTAATDALSALLSTGARTLELMDPASIRAAAAAAPADDPIRAVTDPQATTLLVELRATDDAELAASRQLMDQVVAQLNLVTPARFTSDPAVRAELWAARNGLYTTVAGARPPGTTALLEDIAVPLPELSDTCNDLTQLFNDHGYGDGVIFGHAKDGNVHFMISLSFDNDNELNRYDRFTDDMVDLVLAHHGTLKAEHGAGRIMAPFVRRQFGDELYDVMRQIKQLFDPQAVLAPDVLLTDNPRNHLEHLKTVPVVDPAFDRCVACGYCEPTCPARDLTTTPRQRIAVLRTLANPAEPERAEIARDVAYDVVETCAVDSMCVETCPVHIDTGVIMKGQRALSHGPAVQQLGRLAADHWGGAVTAVREALTVAEPLPKVPLTAVTKLARKIVPTEWMPQVEADLPQPGRPRVGPRLTGADDPAPVVGVYFEACINSIFGGAEAASLGVRGAVRQLAAAAGVQLLTPPDIGGLCCGTVWESKGLTNGRQAMARRVVDGLWEASEQG